MDKRAAFRFPTNAPTDCLSRDRSWPSRMRNVSSSGCMIACPEADLPAGSLLRLRIEGVGAIDGEIVWQHRGHAGIRFRAALDPAMMEQLAFVDTDRGYDPPRAMVTPRPGKAASKAPSGLHGQLVKRTLAEEGESTHASAA